MMLPIGEILQEVMVAINQNRAIFAQKSTQARFYGAGGITYRRENKNDCGGK
jgi:hypothetical protein